MSINNSYFSRNNTLLYNTYTNTGQSPITELFFGYINTENPKTVYSRFIFDLNLDLLTEKISTGLIQTGCTSSMTHTLIMTNTASFDPGLLNATKFSGEIKRASSFDLVLFRIPLSSGITGNTQTWDEGVGREYDLGIGLNDTESVFNRKNFSLDPSNWFYRQTTLPWSTDGIYDNTNSITGSGVNYSGLTIIGEQHFEFGNENISFDMTDEINGILNGTITGVTGWGVAYKPNIELFTKFVSS